MPPHRPKLSKHQTKTEFGLPYPSVLAWPRESSWAIELPLLSPSWPGPWSCPQHNRNTSHVYQYKTSARNLGWLSSPLPLYACQPMNWRQPYKGCKDLDVSRRQTFTWLQPWAINYGNGSAWFRPGIWKLRGVRGVGKRKMVPMWRGR